ncbi:flagellar protein FlaG [Clostridium beijerinckii]|uniref:Flagellar biosynthesis protein FlaG n=1 Tax=Clostridium beijerinckii TaxID=1520 RepID=A0A1S9NCF3_CLOBE|nr:flagellar protein FlaG [Clostridium beijerinckii]OOP75158.1 flagellar biosynthesis protein FlaG [Clostridium beijerinckii]
MDVNNIGQNLNAYNSNSNISQYTGTTTDLAVQQTQKVENQSSETNKNKEQDYNRKDLDDALKKINNFLKDENTHAEYSYYEELKTTTVKVIDDNTKNVILEIPPKKILDMVASMMRQVGLLDKKA